MAKASCLVGKDGLKEVIRNQETLSG